ncbi:MAG: sodium-translocating pyrophosphatase [Candidatus Roseilinea sp.]|uniref:sodium-translocating pyrophosphatase n=1 Tax=Candidatus Roseilinea sp. TaxID=2838777 RepID=UPI004049F1AA
MPDISFTPGALPLLWWIVPISGVIALIAAFVFYRSVLQFDEGLPQMKEIARAVRDGAMAYLRRQYRVVAVVFAALFVVFSVMALLDLVSPVTPFAFVLGGVFSATTGYIGMRAATNTSARTANAARNSLNDALRVAFRGGAVMGLSVVGFALLNASLLFIILYFVFGPLFAERGNPLTQISVIMVGSVFGASAMALFARVGGGIYTKAADVGADLVGKVEAGIPEDDPRNPATIADNVGDNVGDVAGMGADLYESYLGAMLAAASLGVAAVATQNGSIEMQLNYFAMPMALAAVGALLSIFGIFIVRTQENATMQQIMRALDRGINLAAIGVAALALPLTFLMQIERPFAMWAAILIGLAAGVVIGRATEYHTSHEYEPTQSIASYGQSGPATVIIQGLATGMQSTIIPVVAIAVGIAGSFFLAGGASNSLMGLYGIGLASVGMLSTLGITLATDAYGPIADNAGGNAEMAGLPPEVRHRTDELDAVGNTTAATGKGFAIGSAALTAIALLATYLEQVRYEMQHLLKVDQLLVGGTSIPIETAAVRAFTTYYDITPLNPSVMIGLFIGAMAVFYFSAMTMSAVGRAAGAMVQEVRRQFREIPGILAGTAKPDYARCVDISTAGAQREMVLPAIVAILTPVAMGVLFGVAGVVGLLAGAISAGFLMAVMMANAGGAWDNAKKYIEKGAHGGKGSESHRATVVGDTVGDPFKDTSGPSLNILIKLMSVVAIVFCGLTIAIGEAGLLGRLLTISQ